MTSSSRQEQTSQYQFSFKIFSGFTPYLTEEAADKLREYKYAGGDNGIVYKYFYNPLALKLVQYLPDTVAPNLLTLIGFLFTVVPFFMLFGLYGLDFEGKVPAWWCYMEAASYLIYRILDEMDGKQARRTGNSSPLGLLFDHGCDSMTAAIFTLMILKTGQCGNGLLVLMGMAAVSQSFYFCTLEEYYIGGLFLGLGNGVTDASPVLISLFVIQGATDCEFFARTLTLQISETYIFSMTYIHLIAWAVIISQVIASIYNIICILRKKRVQAGEIDLGEEVQIAPLLQQIFAFYLILGLVSFACIVQENPIIKTYTIYFILLMIYSDLLSIIQFIPCLLFASIYSHQTIHIQVSHVSKQKFNPWTRVLLVNSLVLSLFILTSLFFKKSINQQNQNHVQEYL